MSGQHGPLVESEELPEWLRAPVLASAELDPATFPRATPPVLGGRDAAVLVLLGESDGSGPDVLLQLRAGGGGQHSGQVSFPGGAAEPGDGGPVATALREAVEETGLDPTGVRPVALFPSLHIPVSGYQVTPVLAHWERPSRVWAADPAETAAVARVPLNVLAEPANRFQVRHQSGFVGPAFGVPGMVVWGFTAGVLSILLAVGGWERPWNARDVRDLETEWRRRNAAEV